ncbi:unnamed protein product [Hymenolepis diminuta]|uniref:Uncharacterized protein n=1 Tax=Hymenolepis diminuta TaxID=6216 RepID=A0A564YZA8_HYMDI|nr:unnamed protein product [Hymenolepis diminuta]
MPNNRKNKKSEKRSDGETFKIFGKRIAEIRLFEIEDNTNLRFRVLKTFKVVESGWQQLNRTSCGRNLLSGKKRAQPMIFNRVESKNGFRCMSCREIHDKYHLQSNIEDLPYHCRYCPDREGIFGILSEFDIKMASLNPQIYRLIEGGFDYCKFCKFVSDDKERFHEHYHRVHPPL